jgi:hypothetical protein
MTDMTDKIILDLDGLTPDRSYNACLKQCEKLGLIEKIKHGDHEYGRATQLGVNALCVLLQMASNAQEPKNRLKES